MTMHKWDYVDEATVCGRFGKANSSTDDEDVNCLDCLRIDEKEWKKQAETFEHQPKINAIKGLKRVQDRITALTGSKEEGK